MKKVTDVKSNCHHFVRISIVPLRLESKLIVAACRDASVIRGIFGVISSSEKLFPRFGQVVRMASRAHISGQSSGPGSGLGYPWTGVSCTSIVNSTIVPQEATFFYQNLNMLKCLKPVLG
jgi:hypothetical protein